MSKKIANFLLLTSVLAMPFFVVRFSVLSIPTTLLEVLVILAFVSSLLAGKLKGLTANRGFYYGLAFVVLVFIGVLADPDKSRALGLYKAYFVDGFLMFAMIINLDKKAREQVLTYVIISGVIASLISLGMYFMGYMTADGRILDIAQLSPNYLAMFVTPIAVVSLYRCVFDTPKYRYFYLLAGLLMIVTLVLTDSRGGFLALLAGLFVIAAAGLHKAYSRKAAKVALISSLIILIAATAVVFRPNLNAGPGRVGSSSNIRFYIWSTSIEMIGQKPVTGVGLGNYQDYFSFLTKDRVNYPEFISPQALSAHNLYLQLYLTTSVFGLLAFILLIAMSGLWKIENLSASILLVSTLIYGLVDTPLFRNDLAILFWIAIALLYIRPQDENRD